MLFKTERVVCWEYWKVHSIRTVLTMLQLYRKYFSRYLVIGLLLRLLFITIKLFLESTGGDELCCSNCVALLETNNHNFQINNLEFFLMVATWVVHRSICNLPLCRREMRTEFINKLPIMECSFKFIILVTIDSFWPFLHDLYGIIKKTTRKRKKIMQVWIISKCIRCIKLNSFSRQLFMKFR